MLLVKINLRHVPQPHPSMAGQNFPRARGRQWALALHSSPRPPSGSPRPDEAGLTTTRSAHQHRRRPSSTATAASLLSPTWRRQRRGCSACHPSRAQARACAPSRGCVALCGHTPIYVTPPSRLKALHIREGRTRASIQLVSLCNWLRARGHNGPAFFLVGE